MALDNLLCKWVNICIHFSIFHLLLQSSHKVNHTIRSLGYRKMAHLLVVLDIQNNRLKTTSFKMSLLNHYVFLGCMEFSKRYGILDTRVLPALLYSVCWDQ